MSSLKAIGLTLFFGMLSVAVVVGGAIIGVFLAMLTPVILVFTGLWMAWFVTKDYDDKTDEGT